MAYAAALMLPWIGTYTIQSMLPNKACIVITGMAATTLLARWLDAVRGRGLARAYVVAWTAAAVIFVAAAWDRLLALVLGGTATWHPVIGTLSSGVPQLAGPLYQALVLGTWSLGYLALTERGESARRPPQAELIDRRVILRDGKRSILLDADAIDWVQAKGDYVRVRAGAKVFLVRDTINRLERALPVDVHRRIHRSTIVNMRRVREVTGQPNQDCTVVLADGTAFRASRTYAPSLRSALRLRGDDLGRGRS